MPLTPGTRLGVYEVTAPIGEGGMGQVYRATDTTLGRQVAIKILPDAFASDPERLARFEREAKMLASLNHSHIAAIYAVEKSAGLHALVMELVEGEDLSQRIARGAIPIDEALPIAKQIAEALEAAHEQGIIHRDLKPANIKVRPDGTVKVLDFGLAKAMEPVGSAPNVSQSPTITAPAMMTNAGVILGTAAYMAPEQARGKPVDKRTDIWAFGCVLYEMLSGQQAFAGDDVAETLARIIERDPDWNALPATTPPALVRLLGRCLQKNRTRRLHDIADARIEIEEILAAPQTANAVGVSAAPFLRRALPWSLATVIGALMAASWLVGSRVSQPAAQRPAHLQIALPSGMHLAVETEHPVLALSPDGSQVAFVADDRGTIRLYVRDLADPTARPIPGTEGASSPFFSRDGAWIAFFDGGTIKKVSSHGGTPVAVHDSTSTAVNRGASWTLDDTVIIASSPNSGLSRGSMSGEARRSIGEWKWLTKNTEPYAWPSALPDGRHVLFTDNAAGRPDEARVAALSVSTGEIKTLINGGTNPRYSPTGHLLFARGGTLYAVPFDAQRAEVTGAERALLAGLMTEQNGAAHFAVATGGTLAYVAGDTASIERELVWVDRQGKTEKLLDDGRSYQDPRLSPDGSRLAFSSFEGANLDIWVRDLVRGSTTRLTTHPGEDFEPAWSPNGTLAFASEIGEEPENPGPGLAWITGSSGRPESLFRTPGFGNWEFPSSWSADGRWLAFSRTNLGTSRDVFILPMTGDRKPLTFVQTPADESSPMFSPDGRWVAYMSDQTGREEVYVRPFPGPGEPITISTDRGVEPRWARNGQELFYRSGNKLMAVKLGGGSGLTATAPQPLFEGRFEMKGYGGQTANYDVSRDGRFVMIRRKNPVTPTAIHVVLNLVEALQARALGAAR